MRGEGGGAGGGAEGRVGEVVNGRARMDWVVAIRRRKLMENPHFETGSQDEVVILASESKIPLEDVTAMRFILRQPSPEWRTFSLEEISVFRETLVGSGSSASNPGPLLPDSHTPLSKLELLRRHTMDSLKARKEMQILLLRSLTDLYQTPSKSALATMAQIALNSLSILLIHSSYLQGQLVEDDSGSVLLPAKYDIANIHF